MGKYGIIGVDKNYDVYPMVESQRLRRGRRPCRPTAGTEARSYALFFAQSDINFWQPPWRPACLPALLCQKLKSILLASRSGVSPAASTLPVPGKSNRPIGAHPSVPELSYLQERVRGQSFSIFSIVGHELLASSYAWVRITPYPFCRYLSSSCITMAFGINFSSYPALNSLF